eukprot:scaffold259773_cov30-Tisochrysis_lutea.AAC.2
MIGGNAIEQGAPVRGRRWTISPADNAPAGPRLVGTAAEESRAAVVAHRQTVFPRRSPCLVWWWGPPWMCVVEA